MAQQVAWMEKYRKFKPNKIVQMSKILKIDVKNSMHVTVN